MFLFKCRPCYTCQLISISFGSPSSPSHSRPLPKVGPIAQVLLSFLPIYQPPTSCPPLFLSPCPLRVTVLPEACKHRGRWLLQPLPLLPAAHGLGRAAEPPVLPRAVPLPTLLSPRRLPLHHHPHLPTHGVWVCILTLTLKAGGSPGPR